MGILRGRVGDDLHRPPERHLESNNVHSGGAQLFPIHTANHLADRQNAIDGPHNTACDWSPARFACPHRSHLSPHSCAHIHAITRTQSKLYPIDYPGPGHTQYTENKVYYGVVDWVVVTGGHKQALSAAE